MIYIGNTNVTNINIGNNRPDNIWLGQNIVWPSAITVSYTLTNGKAQYSSGSVLKCDRSNFITYTARLNEYRNGVLYKYETVLCNPVFTYSTDVLIVNDDKQIVCNPKYDTTNLKTIYTQDYYYNSIKGEFDGLVCSTIQYISSEINQPTLIITSSASVSVYFKSWQTPIGAHDTIVYNIYSNFTADTYEEYLSGAKKTTYGNNTGILKIYTGLTDSSFSLSSVRHIYKSGDATWCNVPENNTGQDRLIYFKGVLNDDDRFYSITSLKQLGT